MLSYKMVPHYMKDFEMKINAGSYRREKNKCLASGQKAYLNYIRILESTSQPNYKSGNSTVLLYFLKRNKFDVPVEKDECEEDIKLSDKFKLDARASSRRKETSL